MTLVGRIQTSDGPRARANLHDAVTIVLADKIGISRGDVFVAAAEAPERVRNPAVGTVILVDAATHASEASGTIS